MPCLAIPFLSAFDTKVRYIPTTFKSKCEACELLRWSRQALHVLTALQGANLKSVRSVRRQIETGNTRERELHAFDFRSRASWQTINNYDPGQPARTIRDIPRSYSGKQRHHVGQLDPRAINNTRRQISGRSQ